MDGTTTQYAYDGVRLLKELDANGATQMTYTLAPLGDEWYPLVSDRASGASRFYAFDALGTTRALTADSQLPTAVWTDDAYGNVLSATDPAATPHQYLGKLGYHTDAASGLQLLTQRYYDPVVGTFVSEDPVRDGGNWYAYVSGAPTRAVDPVGLFCEGVEQTLRAVTLDWSWNCSAALAIEHDPNGCVTGLGPITCFCSNGGGDSVAYAPGDTSSIYIDFHWKMDMMDIGISGNPFDDSLTGSVSIGTQVGHLDLDVSYRDIDGAGGTSLTGTVSGEGTIGTVTVGGSVTYQQTNPGPDGWAVSCYAEQQVGNCVKIRCEHKHALTGETRTTVELTCFSPG